jgi:hypothetical protein
MMTQTSYFDDYNNTDRMMSSDDESSSSTLFLIRFLQQQQQEDGGGDGTTTTNRGRTVLTVLYLSVLTICFIIPVFFYCRMQCDHRNDQRLREIEVTGLAQAMAESQNAHREESRATRRKYREERRARIIQLFVPTRMVLNVDNFPHMTNNNTNNNTVENNQTDNISHQRNDIENPIASSTTLERKEQQNNEQQNDDGEDTFLLIPKPGLPKISIIDLITTNPNVGNNNQGTTSKRKELRMVENECSICLCEYNVGDDVVWSSNPQCDHVFHETCIEQWLMKQRDGPLCPCCRRDFVIDPFDFGDDDVDIEIGIAAVMEQIPSSTGRIEHEDMEEEEEAPDLTPNATIERMESDVMSDVPATTDNGSSSADNSDNLEDITSGTR